MPATRQQLATAVLQDGGIIGASEIPSAEDQQYVMGVYDLKYAELAAHGNEYVYWPINEIPDAVFLPMRDLVWNEIRTAYGQPIDADKKEQLATTIMRRIRRHVATQASGLPVRAIYF
jgi:hypothetical protein